MARSIQSPGVEIIEHDLTLSPILPAGTNIFMTGFAPKGPTDEILQITSTQELEQVYGTPTNAAERYFYYGARQILNSSNGNLFISRMPYGSDTGAGYGTVYGALVYPIVAVQETTNIVYRNTKFIESKFFIDNVVTTLTNISSLSGLIDSLTAHGMTDYKKLSYTEGQTLNAAFQTYYIAHPTTQLGKDMLDLTNYVVSGYDTLVTTDLTNDTCTYLLGAPKFFDLSLEQYQAVSDGSAFTQTSGTWSTTSSETSAILNASYFGKAGLVVINKIQSTKPI